MDQKEKCDGRNVEITFDDSFYDREDDGCGIWRWVKSNNAWLLLQYNNDKTQKYELEFELLAPNPDQKFGMDIYLDDILWGRILGPCKVVIPLILTPGQIKKICFRNRIPQMHFSNDSRGFCFQFRNYSLHPEPAYIDDTIQEVRKVQLGLLKRLVGICIEYRLEYFAVYGTLLGAIRNQGYLPWDDDIDIAMPRRDFDRLLRLAEEKNIFGEKYFLQTMYNEDHVFYGGYAKLRDNSTTGITRYSYGKRCNNGIWIDIFPLDETNNIEEHYKKINLIQRILRYKTEGKNERLFCDSQWYIAVLSRLAGKKALCDRLDRYFRKGYGGKETYYTVLARIMTVKKLSRFKKEWFADYEIRKFEDIDIRIPIVYDECLKEIFGYNYMIYPDISLRKPHREIYYNPKVSYKIAESTFRNPKWEN